MATTPTSTGSAIDVSAAPKASPASQASAATAPLAPAAPPVQITAKGVRMDVPVKMAEVGARQVVPQKAGGKKPDASRWLTKEEEAANELKAAAEVAREEGSVQAEGAIGQGEYLVLAQAETRTATGGAGTGAAAGGGTAGPGASAMSFTTVAMVGIGIVAGAVAIASSGGGGGSTPVASGPPADTTAPVLQSVALSSEGNDKIVLTYNEALNAVNTPGNNAFAVTVNGNPGPNVTGVTVSGTTVILTLASALSGGDVVSVTYTDPTANNDANAIQDAAGNDAVTAAGGFTMAVASDGYVRGAKIYIDTNNNGIADPSEDTGVVTNAVGGFVLPAGAATGTIIAVGGVNIDTGAPNVIPLKAPAGSTVISPLTTLVQQIVENDTSATTTAAKVATAMEQIVAALNLTEGTDLTSYDPLAVLDSNPTDATAIEVQKATAQVATLVTLAAQSAVADENTSTTATVAINTVVANLADAITTAATAETVTPLDLTDGAEGGLIETIIGTAVDTDSLATVVADIGAATTEIDNAEDLNGIVVAQAAAIDNTAPAAPTAVVLTALSDTGTTGDNKTNDSTPAVRVSFNTTATDGTAAVTGNVVKVFEGATEVGTATLSATNIANGYADVTLTALTDAAHPLTATITDFANNASTNSTEYTLTVDTTAPAAPTLAEQGSTDTANGSMNAAEAVTTTFRVTLPTSGSLALAGDTVTLLGGAAAKTAVLTANDITNGYVDFTVAAADLGSAGAKSLTAKITDTAGNDGTASAALTFTLDTTAAATPTLALNSDTGSSATDTITSSGVVNVSGLETGATWQYSTNNGTNWLDGTGTSFTLTGDGAKSAIVRQTDTAGNTSANSSALVFTLDTTAAAAPTLALNSDTGSSATDNITSSGVVNISGLETGATWQYSTDGGTSWTDGTGASFTLTGDGVKSAIARQTDTAGNTSVNSSAIPFTLDTAGPAFSSGAAANIAENTSTSTAAYTSATSDATSVGYALSGADAALFNINSGSGAVTFKTAPNYEAPADNGADNVYNITVTATDAAGNSTPQNVAITVTNVNEAPTLTSSTTATLAENATGAVYTVTATDQDAGATLGYAIGGADADAFNINASTGVVTFKATPDFETKNSYSITVTASDGTNTTSPQAVTVSVADVNEAPVSSAISGQLAVVNQAYTFDAKTVGQFGDVDAGDSLIFSATGLPAGLSINPATGVISGTATTEDLTNSVTVTATDTGSLTSSQTFNLAVVNKPTITAISANVTQAEGGDALTFTVTISEAVTVVGTPTLTFDVGGQSMTATYTGGTGTNSLTFTATAPAVVDDTSVAVSAIAMGDGGSITGNTSQQAFETSAIGQVVSNFVIDNNAPVFTSSAIANFAENGTGTVYTAATTDVSTVGYSLSGADSSKFTLTNGVLTFNSAPDFETPTDTGNDNVYNVTITATDTLGHFANQNVAITVTNVNESPSITSGTAVNFAENGTGTAYATVASDPDANTTLTYTLGGTDASLFNIDSGTGAVTFKSTPNFEAPADNGANNVYNVTVTASDGALSDSEAIAITVTNVNEPPSITSGTAVNFAENGTGTAYATVASDPDANTTLTYTLTGTDASLFNIDSGTGAVTFKSTPNFEAPADNGANNVYNVTVTASDGALSDSEAIAITVTNVNEAPSITSGAAVNFAENGTGTAYATVASDPDANTTLSYTLGGTDASLFNIDSGTGAVTFKSTPNFEAPTDNGANNVYNITVTASDGALSDSKDVAITVTNVNEAPSITSGAAVNFAENGTGTAYATVASDPDANTTLSYTLTGTDAGLFNIDSGTGVVTFKTAPNFEAPTDNGANNVYNVTVTASDGALTDSETIAITVTNVNEAPTVTGGASTAEILLVNQAVNDNIADLFNDPDAGDTLTYTATGLPSGMNLSPSGDLTGAPTETVTNAQIVFTATDSGSLSVSHTIAVSVVQAPTISSAIDNVTNFDVTSNLVLTASENVTAVAGKNITIFNDGGAGFHGEATVNTQVIAANDTSKVTITGDTITINPQFDLDFNNNYHIIVEAGAFLGTTSGQGNVATVDGSAMNFGTVNPSASSTAATSSEMISGSDTIVSSYGWWDAEGNGAPGGSSVARDFSNGDFAIVGNDLATTGIATNDFYIAVNNFAAGDLIYIDNHGDHAVQRQSDFNNGLIIDLGQAPTQVITGASGTGTGLNGGQFDVTLAGTTDSFSDTAALKILLGNVSYEPLLYG